MHKPTMYVTKAVVSLIFLASTALAGPTLACHEWVSTPGSAFETLEPLRDQAMSVANHPKERPAAIKQIATLRAAMKPNDPLSILKAGYWIAILNSLTIAPDQDGPALIRSAAEMRPNDPEYQFFTALAYFDTDKAEYSRHWANAKQLAKPGSAADKNLTLFGPELLARAGKRASRK